jgi:hypothetical protein
LVAGSRLASFSSPELPGRLWFYALSISSDTGNSYLGA